MKNFGIRSQAVPAVPRATTPLLFPLLQGVNFAFLVPQRRPETPVRPKTPAVTPARFPAERFYEVDDVEWEQVIDLTGVRDTKPDPAEGEQETIGLIEAWTWTEEEGPVWVDLENAWRILGMHG